MAIKKTLHNKSQAGRQSIQAGRRPVNASTGVTSGARRRGTSRSSVLASQSIRQLPPEKQAFARQLQSTARKMSVMGATNTSNIAAKPEFIELLPLFVQKLLVLDVFGSVAMNSRQQLVPYFKVKAENTKGVTKKGTIFSSPFVNNQGADPNFTGRLIRNEDVAGNTLVYVPVLPGSVAISETSGEPAVTAQYVDNGEGGFLDSAGQTVSGYSIDYASGVITGPTGTVVATYEYDNEFVGPNADGAYGASMGKFDLQLDEINLIAEAHEVASYWSIYSAFAAQQEYGGNIADMSKEAGFAQLTAEINSKGFETLAKAASYKPQFDWDASPVLSGAVMPSDYLNMFKLKLEQAAASIYQATRLSQPNRLIVGTTAAAYIGMINGFQADATTDNVGPYKLGALDKFDVYVDPNYDPNTWVMACKSQDIRRNSALFGEYMPFTDTGAIGLADMSVQSGYATMYAMKVVNPATIVSGKILGQF